MVLRIQANGKTLGVVLVGTFVAMTVTTVRVAMPVVVMSTPAAVNVRGSVVLSLLFGREPCMRMGNYRRLTGKQPHDRQDGNTATEHQISTTFPP
jgi:hypothetical protein